MPTPKLSPSDERMFQKWYSFWSGKMGLDPNPDNPEHYYDYRGAYKSGALPKYDSKTDEYHWPSEFKLKGHPRLIINGIDTRTGERVKK